MPNGQTHEKINLVFLAAALPTLYFKNIFVQQELLMIMMGYLIGTYIVNPDLDIESIPRNKWGPLKFIWKPFNHREIMHSWIMWGVMAGVAYFYSNPIYVVGMVAALLVLAYFKKYELYPLAVCLVMIGLSYYFHQPLLVIGIVASSYCHLTADLLMDIIHKIL